MAPLTKKQRSEAAKKAARTRKRNEAKSKSGEAATDTPKAAQARTAKAVKDRPIHENGKAADKQEKVLSEVKQRNAEAHAEKAAAVDEFNERAAEVEARPLGVDTVERPRVAPKTGLEAGKGHGARRDF